LKLQDYVKVVVKGNMYTPSSKGPFTAAAMATSSMAYSGGNASITALGMEMLQSANMIQSNYVITSFHRGLVPSFDAPRTWQTYHHHQWAWKCL